MSEQEPSFTAVDVEASPSILLKSQSIDDGKQSSIGSTTSPIDSPLNYEPQRTVARASTFRDVTTGFHQNFNNYVTLSKPRQESIELSRRAVNDRLHQRQKDARVSFSERPTATTDYRSFTDTPNIYVTYPSTLSSLSTVDYQNDNQENGHESTNNLFSTVSDDLLFVQNAGSFGRRLNPSSSNVLANSVTSNSAEQSYDVSTLRPFASTSSTINTFGGQGASSYTSYSTTTPRTTISYPTELTNDGGRFSTTAVPEFQDVQNSVSSETSSNDYRNSIVRDNTVSAAYGGIFAKVYSNDETHKMKPNENSLLTENSKLIPYGNGDRNETNERITTPGLTAYGKRLNHALYVTLRQSLESDIRSQPVVQTSTPQTVSTFSSKPIVVAELLNYKRDKGFEYSTTFPCTNDSAESSTILPTASSIGSSILDSDTVLVTPKLQGSSSHITTSSVILNPIQAGVSLVNAGETELIADNDQGNRSPAPVNENIEGESDESAIQNFSPSSTNELEKIEADRTRAESYEKINPAFGNSETGVTGIGKSIDSITDIHGNVQSDLEIPGNSQDQQIEIQKSVEIYQNAPVHEIHYPPQVITQVSGINHEQQQERNPTGVVHQQEEQNSYAELQEVRNAEQFQQKEHQYNSIQEQVQHQHQQQQHQSLSSQISLVNSQGASEMGSSYLGTLVRVDNEPVNYLAQQNANNQVLTPGHEDHVTIIKQIRENIPEVKYTSVKAPQINVQVYTSNIHDGNNVQQIEEQQDITELQEQHRTDGSSEEEQSKKAQSQLHRILSESDSVQRYFNGAEWKRFQAQQEGHQQQHQQQQTRLQDIGQLQALRSKNNRVNYGDETDVRQIQQSQRPSILLPYAQIHYASVTEKNVQQNLANNVDENTNFAQGAAQQTYSAPLVSERIVEKTVHVPQPYPVEVPRIIEKKVPYAVEKIVEKKVPVPQPYPVPIQIPVDRIVEKQILQPYPVHIEKIIEKKVPYPVQRLVPHPYPVHILQPYPVEKIVEKPVHIPVTIEKIVEKKIHVPQPYPVQVPIKVPYPVEVTKYVGQSVHIPYGVRYGVSYQQIMKPQSQGLYGNHGSTSLPLYGVSLVSNQYRDRVNATQDFQGYSYNKPAIAFVTGRDTIGNKHTNGWEQFAHGKSSGLEHNQLFAKKSYAGYSSKLPSIAYPLYNHSGSLNRRQTNYRQSNNVGGDKTVAKNEYVGPVPAVQHQQQITQSNVHQKSRSRSSSDQQHQLQHQPLQQHSTAVTRAAAISTSVSSSRRTRQKHENPPHYQTGPGAFRQSKIEYGFKPPMVPSVQYDEKTATKVDN